LQELGPNDVLFIAPPPAPGPGEAALHAGSIKRVIRTLEETTEDWKRVVTQVTTLVGATEEHAAATGWGLDEVTVGLAFDAKGKLAFIAEAGVQASIEVRFKRGSGASARTAPE
jgi:hypothetical protein